MSAIIQECWQHDSLSHPYASQISQLLGGHLDNLTSSDTCCSSASNTPLTAVLEYYTVSVRIKNSNPLSTASASSIVNRGGHNSSCDTATVDNTQIPLNCHNESIQSALIVQMRVMISHMVVHPHHQKVHVILKQPLKLIWKFYHKIHQVLYLHQSLHLTQN